MKKAIMIFGLVFLTLIQSVFSLTLYNVTINSSSNDASLSFSDAVNTSKVYLGSNFVALENFTFNDSREFYLDPNNKTNNISLFNFTLANTNVDSANMIEYFRFGDVEGAAYLLNYTFGAFDSSEYYLPIFFTYFSLGTYSWTFEKIGYISKIFDFNFSYATHNNITFNLTQTKINIEIYDRTTLNLLNQSVNINLIGNPDNTNEFAGSFSTSNGSIQINNITFIPGDYKLELSSENYSNNEYYFTYDGFDEINISIYMIETDLTYPIKYELDDLDGEPKKFCRFKVKQYFIGDNDYLVIDMGRTNSLGQIIFDLQYDVNYQYVLECDGQTQTEPGQKITETPVRITFNPGDSLDAFEDLPNVAGDVTFGNYTNTSGYFRFEYNDLKNIVSKGCLEIYKKKAIRDELIYSKCQNSASATLNQDVNWTMGDRYVAKGYVWVDGQDYLGDQLHKDFLPGADAAWALGFGLWGSILLILTLFLIGSIHHPITAAVLSILGLIVCIGFKALEIEQSLVIGIGIIIVGAILIRRRR